jgi:hypothetical protein
MFGQKSDFRTLEQLSEHYPNSRTKPRMAFLLYEATGRNNFAPTSPRLYLISKVLIGIPNNSDHSCKVKLLAL